MRKHTVDIQKYFKTKKKPSKQNKNLKMINKNVMCRQSTARECTRCKMNDDIILYKLKKKHFIT